MNNVDATDITTSLSPERYREMLKGLMLQSINLVEHHAVLESSLVLSKSSESTPVRVELHQELVSWEQSDGLLAFSVQYRIEGKVKRKKMIGIRAVYIVRYQSEQPVTPDFVRIFQQSTLVMVTYPYFRELVDTTTRRMGTPPLTLPMLMLQ